MTFSLLKPLKIQNSSSASKAVGSCILVGGVIWIGAFQPARSAAVYTFRTNPAQTSDTRDFVDGGIKLTVNNAQGNNILTALSNVGATGGVNTDINNGLCVALFAGYSTGKCQYTTNTAGDPTLTGLTFTFDKPVYLKGFDILKVGGVEKGELVFTSASSSQTFEFLNVGGVDTANGVVFTSFAFNNNFVVEAGAPLTISSVGSVFSSNQAGSFRISNFMVQEVPAPLPLLGFAGAFGWSRRLRKKLAR